MLHYLSGLILIVFISVNCRSNFKPDQADTTRFIKIYSQAQGKEIMVKKINKSNAEWKEELSPEVYRITREAGTEPAFTGAYYYNKDAGVYQCACCGADLFDSDTKFESGSGWPSFYQAINENNIALKSDQRLFMERTEILCKRCNAHLGHVFDDGPKPTGLRFCVNSAALKFKSAENDKK